MVILAWMGDELSSGQARDWYTHTRTHRPTDAGDDNTRRPKLASGKNDSNIHNGCLIWWGYWWYIFILQYIILRLQIYASFQVEYISIETSNIWSLVRISSIATSMKKRKCVIIRLYYMTISLASNCNTTLMVNDIVTDNFYGIYLCIGKMDSWWDTDQYIINELFGTGGYLSN